MDLFNKTNKGQSIIEAMVAIGILTVGLLGMLSLLSRSLALNRTISSETTATYLASEGIEVTKNILDHDFYALGATWGTCGGACLQDGAYTVSYNSLAPQVLAVGATCTSPISIPVLLYSASTRLYSYTAGGTATTFRRCIEIDHTANASGKIIEVTVKSDVSWTSGSFSDTANLEDHFYNWHP